MKMQLPECSESMCFCFDFECNTCGVRYKDSPDYYHWPLSRNLCAECDAELPKYKCPMRKNDSQN